MQTQASKFLKWQQTTSTAINKGLKCTGLPFLQRWEHLYKREVPPLFFILSSELLVQLVSALAAVLWLLELWLPQLQCFTVQHRHWFPAHQKLWGTAREQTGSCHWSCQGFQGVTPVRRCWSASCSAKWATRSPSLTAYPSVVNKHIRTKSSVAEIHGFACSFWSG